MRLGGTRRIIEQRGPSGGCSLVEGLSRTAREKAIDWEVGCKTQCAVLKTNCSQELCSCKRLIFDPDKITSLLLDVKKLNFRTKIRSMNLNLMHILASRGDDEYVALCSKYNFPVDLTFFNFKRAMWLHFEQCIAL